MLGVPDQLLNLLKIRRAVLAQGADEVLGERISLVDVAADLADVALLAVGLGLGLDVLLIIGARSRFFSSAILFASTALIMPS